MSQQVSYTDNFDGASLIKIAAEFGTPLYIYSQSVIEDRYRSLSRALNGVSHRICYAVKANSNLSVLKEFLRLGAGFDIVSGGELRRVLAAGGSGSGIVFSGVGKSREELELAISSDIDLINIESAAELKAVAEVAATLKRKANIAFRINPDIPIAAHPHLVTGLETSKFGVSLDEALLMWESIKNRVELNFVGIACHIGSGIYDLEPLEAAYSLMIKAAKIFSEKGATISKLDFGGGFGIGYSGHEPALNISAFGEMVRKLTTGLPYEFIFEPGKYLIAEAGVLLAKVLYIKTNSLKNFAIIDAGMNDLIRPLLYDAYHKIDLVGSDVEIEKRPTLSYDIVGPVCESACYLAKDRQMPELREGDLLIVRDAGAYGSSMSSRYNSRRLAAEVMVKDGGVSLVRKREEYSDLWANEFI